MNVGYLLNRVEKDLQTLDPEKEAIKMESGKTLTYRQLNEKTNRYANTLRTLNIKKGDRVGIFLYNNIEYIALYFAIAKIGAIAVRLNYRLETEELEYALNDSGTKLLCFDSNLAKEVNSIRNLTSVEEYICFGENVPKWANNWELLDKGSDIFNESEEISKSDPLMLMYTSGTTGKPKGALWTHENTLWFASMQALKWEFNSSTIGMTTGPLYHVGAFEDIGIATLLSGGTFIITKSGGFDINRILNVIEETKVTDCFMFPFMLYEMLQLPNIESFKLEQVNNIYSGGDPITSWAIDKLYEYFPHIGLIQVFGLTEGTPIATSLDSKDSVSKGYTAGKAMPFTEIKIVDSHNKRLDYNQVGEICVKGPAVVNEYWNKPEKTIETFIDGWCHTEDLGYIDEDGYLTVSGRQKDMIRSGGENIYPVEVENVLIQHEAVQDIAIIGIPDSTFIETVCAVIVLRPDEEIDLKQIEIFIEGKLASYKKPRKIEFVSQIPRTASGKIMKYKLREKYS